MIKLSFQDSPILAKIGNFVKAKKQIIILGVFEITLLITAFLLGIITGKNHFKTEPIILEGVTPVSALNINVPIANQEILNSSGEYVASNRGKMYYPVSCSAANSLKAENKIYFKTIVEAELAGYKRSASCP